MSRRGYVCGNLAARLAALTTWEENVQAAMAMMIIVEVEKPIMMPSFVEITNKNGMTGNGIYRRMGDGKA